VITYTYQLFVTHFATPSLPVADGSVGRIVVDGDGKVGSAGRLIITGKAVTGICALELRGGQETRRRIYYSLFANQIDYHTLCASHMSPH